MLKPEMENSEQGPLSKLTDLAAQTLQWENLLGLGRQRISLLFAHSHKDQDTCSSHSHSQDPPTLNWASRGLGSAGECQAGSSAQAGDCP